jgi:hypothetical protein
MNYTPQSKYNAMPLLRCQSNNRRLLREHHENTDTPYEQNVVLMVKPVVCTAACVFHKVQGHG